jgi:hypothetical protein
MFTLLLFVTLFIIFSLFNIDLVTACYHLLRLGAVLPDPWGFENPKGLRSDSPVCNEIALAVYNAFI